MKNSKETRDEISINEKDISAEVTSVACELCTDAVSIAAELGMITISAVKL